MRADKELEGGYEFIRLSPLDLARIILGGTISAPRMRVSAGLTHNHGCSGPLTQRTYKEEP